MKIEYGEREMNMLLGRYDEKVYDLLILTLNPHVGAAFEEDMLNPSLDFDAYTDLETGEFVRSGGHLEWVAPRQENRRDYGYEFQKCGIYHIRCRKGVVSDTDPEYGVETMFLLTEVIEDGASDPQLERLREKYMKPVYLESEKAGRFTLNRDRSVYTGNMKLLGNDCTVCLETDRDGGRTAKKAVQKLELLLDKIEDIDTKMREYAAGELLGKINEKIAKGKNEITEKEFIRRIILTEINVTPGGDLDMIYSDDGISGGRTMIVYTNINGKADGADLIG